jgi:four helix bundle protein
MPRAWLGQCRIRDSRFEIKNLLNWCNPPLIMHGKKLCMGKIKRFEELEVWKSARNLAGMIYSVSKKPPLFADYGLRDQIRRASISIVSNIAEGFESQSNPSFCRYLASAGGSAAEVRAQLYLALDLRYVSLAEFTALISRTESISRQKTGFIKYLKRSSCTR